MDYYLDILVSLTECCIKMNKLDEAMKNLEKMNRYNSLNRFTDKDQSIISLYLAFRIYLKNGNIKKASSMITHLEKLLVKYKGKIQIDTEFAVMFYISVTLIEEKKFTKALSAINRMLMHPMLSKKSDYECYIKILNLVVHYELKNYELLRHLVLSTYRYLCRHQKLFKTEELVIDFIRKMPNVKSEDDLNYFFGVFAVKLSKLKKDKYEKNAFEYFDLERWVTDKLKNIVLRGKFP
jgi:tetratricopeptide (TPR) repeat protein